MALILARTGVGRSLAANNLDQLLRGRGERTVLPVHEIELPDDAHLPEPHVVQDSSLDLPLDAHARHNRHSLLHLDEELNAFNGRQLDVHPQRNTVAREHLHDAQPVRRFHDVADKVFISKFADIYFSALRQTMARPYNQSQRVTIKLDSRELALLRQVGNHAHVELVVQHFARHVAREHAMNSDVNSRGKLSIAVKRREQRVNRALVDPERNLSALEPAQFLHAFADFFAEIQHAVGVFEQKRAGIGQRLRAGAANEERLPYPVRELAHRDADRGLRTIELLGGTREAALPHDGLKHLQRC